MNESTKYINNDVLWSNLPKHPVGLEEEVNNFIMKAIEKLVKLEFHKKGNIEIEAKYGKTWSKNLRQGYDSSPISNYGFAKSEFVWDTSNNHQLYFNSDVGKQLFEMVNKYVKNSSENNKNIEIETLKSIDKWHIHQNYDDKIRVSYMDSKIIDKIIKVRIADLYILDPRSHIDIRISINMEYPYNEPIENIQLTDGISRGKNRTTYIYKDLFHVDFTLVSTINEINNNTKTTHEIELEMTGCKYIQAYMINRNSETYKMAQHVIQTFITNLYQILRTCMISKHKLAEKEG